MASSRILPHRVVTAPGGPRRVVTNSGLTQGSAIRFRGSDVERVIRARAARRVLRSGEYALGVEPRPKPRDVQWLVLFADRIERVW
jgi:hypothetical protein